MFVHVTQTQVTQCRTWERASHLAMHKSRRTIYSGSGNDIMRTIFNKNFFHKNFRVKYFARVTPVVVECIHKKTLQNVYSQPITDTIKVTWYTQNFSVLSTGVGQWMERSAHTWRRHGDDSLWITGVVKPRFGVCVCTAVTRDVALLHVVRARLWLVVTPSPAPIAVRRKVKVTRLPSWSLLTVRSLISVRDD